MPSASGSRWNRFYNRFENFSQSAGKIANRATTAWESITEGSQLWDDFKADAQAGYKFYSKDVDWSSFEQKKKWKRRLYAARALSWALLRKLSPARRIFLLLTLAYVIWVLLNPGNDAALIVVTGALLPLLALELGDRVTMKRDLEIARDIQRWLVPESPPIVDGIAI